MKFQLALEQIDDEIHPLLGRGGMVASYIPALARVLDATENPLLGMKTLGLFVGMT